MEDNFCPAPEKKGLSQEMLERQEPKDRAVLKRYFNGDLGAVGELADLYASRLYGFGLKMCGNSQDAQDMVQDTFLSVIKHLAGFRGETKLKNWLFRVASSACIKKRRGKNRKDRELALEDLKPEPGKGAPLDVPDWTQNPVKDLMNDELRRRLSEAIQGLPQLYRLVFSLRDVEGFSTAETAEILDISDQAVKTRLHRARAFLRKDLAEYYQEHRGGEEAGA